MTSERIQRSTARQPRLSSEWPQHLADLLVAAGPNPNFGDDVPAPLCQARAPCKTITVAPQLAMAAHSVRQRDTAYNGLQ